MYSFWQILIQRLHWSRAEGRVDGLHTVREETGVKGGLKSGAHPSMFLSFCLDSGSCPRILDCHHSLFLQNAKHLVLFILSFSPLLSLGSCRGMLLPFFHSPCHCLACQEVQGAESLPGMLTYLRFLSPTPLNATLWIVLIFLSTILWKSRIEILKKAFKMPWTIAAKQGGVYYD